MIDEAFLRGEVEPYIDKLYLGTPLLKRHRDSAAIHLLRILEDSTRFVTMKQFEAGNKAVQFHTRLRWAQEAIPWALRWVWRDCPLSDVATLDLAWAFYREAHEIMDLGFRYYQLCRCFVLYSRGFFCADTVKEEKRVRFFFRSDAEQRRDAASAIYSILQDDPPLRPGGALVVDDVDANWGFRSFTQSFSGHQSMICEAEPLHPDLRRFNKKGLFGIILKEPTVRV